jgi:alpha-galactosidase
MIVIAGALLAAVACALLPPPAGAHSAEADRKPLLGWSSWSFLRHHPSMGAVEAEARAMRSSGLAAIGYQYVNLDGS